MTNEKNGTNELSPVPCVGLSVWCAHARPCSLQEWELPARVVFMAASSKHQHPSLPICAAEARRRRSHVAAPSSVRYCPSSQHEQQCASPLPHPSTSMCTRACVAQLARVLASLRGSGSTHTAATSRSSLRAGALQPPAVRRGSYEGLLGAALRAARARGSAAPELALPLPPLRQGASR